MAGNRKSRKRPVYAKVRQLDWLMWRFLSEQRCCFCNEVLYHDCDTKTYNNVTIHHLEGSRATDDFNEAAPIDEMLFAHSACHKAFHMMERHQEKGWNIDERRFTTMQKMVEKHRKEKEKKARKSA